MSYKAGLRSPSRKSPILRPFRSHSPRIADRTQKEHCHRLLAEWIATTGDHFPLPDIALRERGTPAEQYRQQLAERGAGT